MFSFTDPTKTTMPSPSEALPGRSERMPVPARHAVLGTPLEGDFPGLAMAMFGIGCFCGVDRKFWVSETSSTPGLVFAASQAAAKMEASARRKR